MISPQLRTPRFVGLLLLGLLLSACQPVRHIEPPLAAATSEPTAQMLANRHYRILPEVSELRVLVYRDGPLARLGHNHVLIHKGVHGEIDTGPTPADTRVALALVVSDFVLDDPAARAQEGPEFATVVSDSARQATRKNLLGAAVLDLQHYPEIRIESQSLSGTWSHPDITLRITIRNTTHALTVPVAVTWDGAQIVVSGQTSQAQSDFGIVPFSVLGGGLRVRDTLAIRFRLVAAPST